MASSDRTVLIIGGGYGGIALYKELDKKLPININLILISRTNFFYHTVASPRALVFENLTNEIVIPYDRFIKGTNRTFIHGKVTNMTSNRIEYIEISSNNEGKTKNLSFDYAILSIGCSYDHPFRANEYDHNAQVSSLKEINEKFKNSNKILVVGGGPVGVETAGEFATEYPSKSIKLITTSNRLVPTMSTKLSSKVLEILRNKNVDVIFNDTIDGLNRFENFKEHNLITKNGRNIDFDAYLICYGTKPNTNFIQKNWLNENGFIKVNEYLQVEDYSNIYAIGDCCSTNEPKMILYAEKHVSIVVFNLMQTINNQSNLKTHSNNFKAMVVTVGRNNAVMQIQSCVFSNFLTSFIKNKNLFLPKYRSLLGYS